MQIRTAYLNDIGGREYNDDTVRIISQNDGLCVFVGDGLGGYAGGKAASSKAGDIIGNYRKKNTLLDEAAMVEAAKAANEGVLAEQKRSHGRMKTTMVVLTVEGRQARWMHVGDSRLYYFKNGKLQSQTIDHSVSQMAVVLGEITRDQIRGHCERSRLLRVLGSEEITPEIHEVVELKPGRHAFLLCSDGFWESVLEDEMVLDLYKSATAEEWLSAMRYRLMKRMNPDHDNHTAVAVFVRVRADGTVEPVDSQ